MQSIITYESLYETLMKEKTRKDLQKLPEDFFQKLAQYLKDKTAILDSQKQNSSPFLAEIKRTEKQVYNIKRLIIELHERRERKIIETALFSSRSKTQSKSSTINISPEEIIFYEKILNLLEENQNRISELLEQKSKALKNPSSNTLIRFLAATPKFVGLDDFIYGPFEKNDIANISSQIAEILIKKKRAEKILID